MKLQIVMFCFLITLSSCSQKKIADKSSNRYNDEPVELTKNIKLGDGFSIYAGKGEDFDEFQTYTYLKIIHDDNVVFKDDALTEYQFNDKLYPILHKLDNNSYLLAIEVNGRPLSNELLLLKFKDYKVISKDTIQAFSEPPKDYDNDGIIEYRGDYSDAESWGNGDTIYTNYNPSIFYELNSNAGFVIDSSLTVKSNVEFYDEFKGYEITEDIFMTFPKKMFISK